MKKASALLVVLALLLAGCGSVEDVPLELQTKEFQNERLEAKSAILNAQPAEAQYPLTEEVLELTLMYPLETDAALEGDMAFVKTMEETTGVTMKLDAVPSTQYQGSLNSEIGAGCPHDIYMDVPDQYLGEEFGAFLELSDLVTEQAPNYISAVNSIYDGYQAVIEDDGGIWRMYQFYDQPQMLYGYGAVARQDWMEETGFSELETYDDIHDYLMAVKDRYQPSQPFRLPQTGVTGYDNFTAGFGVSVGSGTSAKGFYQVDGQVKFGAMEQGFQNYLTLMGSWYNEGLITIDFLNTVDVYSNSYLIELTADPSGLWFLPASSFSLLQEMSGYPITPVMDPVQSSGDQTHISAAPATNIYGGGYSLSLSSAEPELAIRALDWLYSGQAVDIGNFGTLATSNDGQPVWAEEVSEAMSSVELFYANTSMSLPGIMLAERQKITLVSRTTILEVWNRQKDSAYMLPSGISFTTEEQEEYSVLVADISTYVDSLIPSFIIGEMEISDLETMKTTLKEMKIDRCLEIWQRAYDRFMSR